MLTRSNTATTTQTLYSSNSRKSLPAILTRGQKRKSHVLQDDNDRLSRTSRISNSSSGDHGLNLGPSTSSRTRHSLSIGSDLHLHHRQGHRNNLFSASSSIRENFHPLVHDRKIPIHSSAAVRRRSRHSTPSDVSSERSFRRRLVEKNNDSYETRSNSTVSSSASSSVSIGSNTSSSGISYITRRSRRSVAGVRGSNSDEELSTVSSRSGISELANTHKSNNDDNDDVQYGLRSKEDTSGESSLTRRNCALPPVCFANCEEIWQLMCKMDFRYKRQIKAVFHNESVICRQMRAILIDWLMDVCEAYTMHRETLYLAIDYLDRYLAVQHNVIKQHLQLLGITCLFVAAKLEEIYPPKLKTFAYVTDGACSESEILDMELVLMKTLKWKLTPITPATWVNVYLQILGYKSGGIYCTRSGADFLRASVRLNRDNKPDDSKLIKHLYDAVDYVNVLRLVDLSILNGDSLIFSYATVSAAAIYHTKGRTAALTASGFSWDQLSPCVHWMAPAALVLRRHEIPSVLPTIEGVTDEYRHLIQSHGITLEMMGDAEALATTNKISSPITQSEGILTPPSSQDRYHRRSKQVSSRY